MLEGIIAERMHRLRVQERQLHHHELHSLCLEQEKHVVSQICQSKTFDIYHSIATVCPTQADIREISNDEVTSRLHILNNFNSGNPRSFSKYNQSPEEEDHDKLEEELQPRMDGFCTFSQPSIRNFLDEVEESSLWNHGEEFHD